MKSIKFMIIRLLLVGFLLTTGLAVPFQAAGAVSGATLTVNSNSDADNGSDGLCTLREAITAALNNTNYHECVNSGSGYGDDQILFSISGSTTITLTSSLPSLFGGILTIDGSNSGTPVTIDGASAYQPFNVLSTLTLMNITIQHGAYSNSGGAINSQGTLSIFNSTFLNNTAVNDGGAIGLFGGTAIIANSTFSGNSANYGGGIALDGGTLTLTNSTLSGNTAAVSGGAFSTWNPVSATINNTIMANSIAPQDCVKGSGASTQLTGSNNIIETTNTDPQSCSSITSTTSDPSLGALTGSPAYFKLGLTSPARNKGDDTICEASPVSNASQNGVTRPQGSHCDIGSYEIPSSTLVVDSNTDVNADDGVCTLREAITNINNGAQAFSSAGECAAGGEGVGAITFAGNYAITLASQLPSVTSAITITGNGAANTIVQANASPDTATYRVFQVGASGDLTLDSLTVRNGRCDGSCTVLPQGGAWVFNEGTVAIKNSLLTANAAVGDGGGGLYNYSGTATITASTFYQNSSTNAGGAINNDGGIMTITNSTIANNSATGNTGGGIGNNGTLNIYNSTISGNTSVSVLYDGDNIYQGSGVLNLYNTIIANSTSHGDCGIYGGTVNATNSLIESTGSQACGLTNGTNGNIIGSDPALNSLTSTPDYFPLLAGSPAINAGNDATCTAAPVSNTSQNGVTRPQGSHCDIGSYEFPQVTLIIKSVGLNDGWILESSETSGVGGTMDSTATTFNLGDDLANKQYRAILHFDTSALPDAAVITSATLKIKKYKQIGSNPFTILGGLKVDMRKPSFGSTALALTDFNSAAGKTSTATFGATPLSNWYSALLSNGGNLYINRTGTTQFRLRFSADDNNDLGDDYMKFFSGNYSNAANHPQLVIYYYVP